jgi:hypothetical protein
MNSFNAEFTFLQMNKITSIQTKLAIMSFNNKLNMKNNFFTSAMILFFYLFISSSVYSQIKVGVGGGLITDGSTPLI